VSTLNYSETDFRHRILYLQERNRESGPVHPIRLLISEGKLIRIVAVHEHGQWVMKTVQVVSVFAAIGDVLRPKSFAGLFGAAPPVALATLGLAIATEGASYVATESRSMIAGALALFAYASFVSWIMMRHPFRALLVTTVTIPLWLGMAFGTWYLVTK
jgi:hypothetical protein